MDYTIVRDTIKSGDLLAFSSTGWWPWRRFKIQMIRLFTQSEYSHVGVAWVVGGRVFCLEAVEPAVRIFPLSKLGDFYHIPMNINWTNDIEECALSIIGEEYSQLEAIESYFDDADPNDTWQCVEFAKTIYKTAGLNLSGKDTPTQIVKATQLIGMPTYFVSNSK